jgi:hypothetical protein
MESSIKTDCAFQILTKLINRCLTDGGVNGFVTNVSSGKFQVISLLSDSQNEGEFLLLEYKVNEKMKKVISEILNPTIPTLLELIGKEHFVGHPLHIKIYCEKLKDTDQ